MNRKLIVFVAVLAVAVALVACDKQSESQRQVVTVSSMNDNAPFFSDVLEQGDTLFIGGLPYTPDDFIRDDLVPVTFSNRGYSSVNLTADGLPFSDFLITRYRVEWSRTDGGPSADVPPTYDGATSIRCKIDELTIGWFLLVPFEVKNLQFMRDINYLSLTPARGDEYLMIATFTFWGHEIGTEREWSFQAGVSVNFADPVVKSKKKV